MATAAEAAGHIDISVQRFREFVAAGVIERQPKGAYDLNSVRTVYIRHLRNLATGRGSDSAQAKAAAERGRLAKAQADLVELKGQTLRGDLLDAAAVEQEWAAILRDVRASMLALPSRLQQQLSHLSAHDLATIDRELRDALTELASPR